MSTSDDWIAGWDNVSRVCVHSGIVLSLPKEGTDSNSDISGKSELDPKTIGGRWVLGLCRAQRENLKLRPAWWEHVVTMASSPCQLLVWVTLSSEEDCS